MLRAMLFDTETTGLMSTALLQADRQPSVIEFYGALYTFNGTSKYRLLRELDLLIKPPTPFKEEGTRRKNITAITGLTNDMLAGKPMFAQVAKQIFSFIEEAPLVIAHNLAFDKEVLNLEGQRLQRVINWPMGLCTIEQTAHLKGDRMKLEEMYTHLFKEKFATAHRAKADVQALAKCCNELHRQGII
jgi:DNA polymerase III epsilon subunit-like protein